MTGSSLKKLTIYKDTLKTLKLASNKITSLADLDVLKELPHLQNLDLANNPISNYSDHVWKMLPNLKILDNYDRTGQEVLSELDDEYGEEELKGLEDDLIDDEEGEFDFGEEGEGDMYGEEDEEDLSESDSAPAPKRQKH